MDLDEKLLDSQDLEDIMTNYNDNEFPNLTMSDLGLGHDSSVKQEQPMSNQHLVHLERNPNLLPIQSNYQFEVGVSHDNTNVVYHPPKLFIKMGSKMTIDVKYLEQQPNEQLFLRAMIIFSKPAEMHLPVKRCANHRGSNSQPESLAASIIKINDPKAVYIGEELGETFSARLSVVVPLTSVIYDDQGKVTHSIGLEFGCQNSCSSGINRRPTSMVFTLEKQNYELVGKSAIEFKVCSCPKRDSEREREPKRKGDGNEAFPRGKRPKIQQPPKVKVEPESESDTSEPPAENSFVAYSMTTIPPFLFPTALAPDLFRDAFNLVAGKMAEDGNGGLEQCLKSLKKLRKRAENPTQ